jgi:ubiquinone/menaquinone biosynthesis C-methylase UbiE
MPSILSLILRVLGWLILAVLCWVLFVETVVRLVRRYWHFPVPPIAAYFLNSPLRRAIQPPEKVVGWMDIHRGMQVLELGPGPGTFTFEAAKLTGPEGQVYAVDIQPQMIAKLEQEIGKKGISNVIPKLASAYELPVPDRSMDRAFMITVLCEIPDRQRALGEIKRVLKPDGLLAVGEFLFDPDYPRRQTVITWCRQAGFELVGNYGSWLHYLLVFRQV